MRSCRPLTPSENAMALVTLDLISDWHRWVHRRVESFRLADPVAVERHVSVDFTLTEDVKAPLGERRKRRVYCVPLGMLRKRKLRRFDLRDEADRAVPLMTAGKNGAIAAGVLLHASDTFAHPPSSASSIPRAVWESLWAIANLPPEEATRHWEDLGRPRDRSDAPEREWREALVTNREFMALASDLARNFLVLVPLESHPDERRILKFAYEETQPDVDPLLAQLAHAVKEAVPGWLKRRHVGAASGSPELSEAGAGLIRIEATSLLTDESGNPARDEKGDFLPSQPQHDLEILIRGEGQLKVVHTGPDGCAYCQLPPGDYTLEERVPRGLLEMSDPRREIRLEAAATEDVEFPHLQVGTLAMRHVFDAPPRPERLYRRVLRFWGWRSERLVFLVPAVGQAAGYHVEFESPEDLASTRGRLEARPSYWDPEASAPMPVMDDTEMVTVPRSHLYLSGVGQDRAGTAVFNLRPRPSTIIRAAALSAAITTGLLAVVASHLEAVRGQVGPTITLLLLIPGALSAYVARPREHPFTTRAAFGVRVIAMSPALWAFLTAAVLVLSRPWSPTDTGYKPGRSWGLTGEACTVLTLCSVASCVTLLALWRFAANPPEQKPRTK